MPQIQYSEKYYDDIYEYRYVRMRATFSRAPRCAIRFAARDERRSRAKSRVPPRSAEPATGTTAMPRAISDSCAVLDTRDTRVRARAYRSARVATSPPARFPRARASGSRSVPAAYPFEIVSPLTSLPPLPPSTDTSCFPPTSPSSCLRVACSPRYVSEPRYGSTPPPRPNAGDTEARCRNRIAAALDPLPRRLRGSSARLLAPRARVVRSARRN